MSESPGERRLNAEEVNRLASELDGQPFNAEPIDDDSAVGTVPSAGPGVIAGLEESRPDHPVFPPGNDGNEKIGGSVEDRATLREEESR